MPPSINTTWQQLNLPVSQDHMLTDQIISIIHRRVNRTRNRMHILVTLFLAFVKAFGFFYASVREGNSSRWVCPEIIIVVVQVYEITYALANVYRLSARDRRRWVQAHVCRCTIWTTLMCWSSVLECGPYGTLLMNSPRSVLESIWKSTDS